MDLKNWKTTAAGLLMGLPQLAAVLGIIIPEPFSKLALAIGALMLYFAKDKNVTNGTVNQGGIR